MKVAYKKDGKVVIREQNLRKLQPDEIRIKVDACGICGTDLLESLNETKKESPFGHEIAGVVLELGSSVSGLSVGQNVVIESATPCGHCSNCRNARQELCTDIRSFFYLNHFGFAEETIVPAICAIPCDYLTPEVACLSEPLGVAIDMFRLADISIGSNVVVSGCGPIGLMTIALAKKAGAGRIFAVDSKKRKKRMDIAIKSGADEFIAIEDGGISSFKFPCEVDRCMVTSPPPTLKDVFGAAAKGAIVSFIGIGFEDNSYSNFDVNSFHFKKLQLRASFASPALFTPLALSYLKENIINGGEYISHTYCLNDIAIAMETAKTDLSAVKVIVKP